MYGSQTSIVRKQLLKILGSYVTSKCSADSELYLKYEHFGLIYTCDEICHMCPIYRILITGYVICVRLCITLLMIYDIICYMHLKCRTLAMTWAENKYCGNQSHHLHVSWSLSASRTIAIHSEEIRQTTDNILNLFVCLAPCFSSSLSRVTIQNAERVSCIKDM